MTDDTKISLDSAQRVIEYIRSAYGAALEMIGLPDPVIDAVDHFVDTQLVEARDMVKTKIDENPGL